MRHTPNRPGFEHAATTPYLEHKAGELDEDALAEAAIASARTEQDKTLIRVRRILAKAQQHRERAPDATPDEE